MLRLPSTFSRTIFIASLPALLLATAGCGSDSSELTIDTIRDGIQGGYPDSTDKGVVGIAIDMGGGQIAGCTGTLITPNLVLTARHCTAQMLGTTCGSSFGSTRPASAFEIFTAQTYTPMQSGRTVSQVLTAPGPNNICGNDVAILRLTQNVPASAATPIAPRICEQPHFDEIYSAVGYGITCPSCFDSLSRRRRDNLQVFCVGDCGYPSRASDQEWWGDDGICSGDSGGPALDSQGRTFGIASRAGEDGNNCVGGLYERLDSHADFIRQTTITAANQGGYPVPSWTTACTGTGETCNDCLGMAANGGACASAVTACTNSADCNAWINCVNGCATPTCQYQCWADHPAGALLYGAIEDCQCNTCSNLCTTECAVDQCGFTFSTTTCNQCFQTNCCAQGTACGESTSCVGLTLCLNTCSTSTCTSSCRSSYPQGTATYDAMNACISGSCSAECGGGGIGGFGGFAGSSAGGFGGFGNAPATGGTAGVGTGGVAGAGVGGGIAGAAGAAAFPGTGGSVAGAAGQPTASAPEEDEGGCGCGVVGARSQRAALGWLALLGLLVARKRRRR